MKKQILISVFLTFILTLTAFAAVNSFTDSDSFPDWAADSINKMSDIGVINGYEDESFGSNDTVTRAQLATIVDRYDKNVSAHLNSAFMNYASFDGLNLDPEIKAVLALARSDYNVLDGDPTSNGCDKIEAVDIPTYYNVYKCLDMFEVYYVNFVYDGPVPESGDATIIHFSEWLGPYYLGGGKGIRAFY